MSFGLKMPVTVLQGTILDFAITTLPNNTRAMDHTVERAKVLIGLFDHPSHGIDIRHTRVRIQNFTTKRLADIVNLFIGMEIIAEIARRNTWQSGERLGIFSS